jgi:glycosyltransferase involved in cell wall biosynthesis
VFVVHNGFEATRALRGPVRAGRTAGETAEIVMAARMVPEKDFATLLEAGEILYRSGRSVRITLMGSGPDREPLAAQWRDAVEAGRVRFLDCGLDVMPVLATADIGVLLTDPLHHAEGLSNSIMEYMASGLPVVCTESGGNREVVLEGRTGFIVPPHDARAVADALARLVDDPGSARRFGEAGSERIRDEFSTRVMVERTVAVYETVIGDRPKARSRGDGTTGTSMRESH